MTDKSLREAIEKRLDSLPLMVHLGNDYPTQALPKAELLDILAAHPPSTICGDRMLSPIGKSHLLCRLPENHRDDHADVSGATWNYTQPGGA